MPRRSAALLVPRLGEAFFRKIHSLIASAKKRSADVYDILEKLFTDAGKLLFET